MTIHRPLRLAACAALGWLALAPPPALALPPNRSISLQGVAGAGPAAGQAGLALQAGAWLEGDLEATARAAIWSAARTGGRGAVLAVVGLRWSPGDGRWRPLVGVEGGLAWADEPRAAVAVRAGVERLLSRGWSVSASAGLAWAGRGVWPEGAVGLTCYF